MLKRILATVTAVLALTIIAVPNPAIAGDDSDNRVRVEAEFSGMGLASGEAEYRERQEKSTLQQRFKVEVEDATPGDELGVSVNGTFVATLFVNDLGRAEIQFRTAEFIDDPGDGQPIDTEFPMLRAGDTVTVGKMTATFEND